MGISRLGYEEFATADGADTGNVTITVPSGCDFALVFHGSWWYQPGSYNSNVFTLNGETADYHLTAEGNDSYNYVLVEGFLSPESGSKTLAYDIGMTPYSAWRTGAVVYYSGVDQTTPIADSDGAQNAESVTGLTAADWMVGAEVSDASPDISTEQTEILIAQVSGGCYLGIGEQSGNETEFVGGSGSYYAVVALTMNAASGGTPVSKTEALELEALAAISVQKSGLAEALAALAETITANIESVMAQASTLTLSLEGLQAIAAVKVSAGEALDGVTITHTVYLEALAKLDGTQTINAESVQGTYITGILPFEALGAAGAVSSEDEIPIEVLAAIQKIEALNAESQLQIAGTQTAALEALGTASRTTSVAIEALGQALLEATGDLAIEALGTVPVTLSLNMEALAQLDAQRSPGAESLLFLYREAEAAIEALRAISQTSPLPIEADGTTVITTPSARVVVIDTELRRVTVEAGGRSVTIEAD